MKASNEVLTALEVGLSWTKVFKRLQEKEPVRFQTPFSSPDYAINTIEKAIKEAKQET